MEIKKTLDTVIKKFRVLQAAGRERMPGFTARAKELFGDAVRVVRQKPRTAAAVVIILVLVLSMTRCGRQDGDGVAGGDSLLYEVSKGPLTISINATGSIENREKVIVRNAVPGARATILWLIDEGAKVKAGDLLVDLDSAEFEDAMLDSQVEMDNTTSQVVRARETLAITMNQAQADVEKAELTLKFAKMALEKYTEGDYPQELQKAETDITIAKEELRRSEERLAWSAKLVEQDFITRSEYEADELAVKKQEIELQMAEKRLELLDKYTHVVQVEKLKSDVLQAELALDRDKRKVKADILQAEVDLRSKEVSLARHIERISKIREQIDNCKIYAPVDGLVVYATSLGGGRHWRREPLAEGATINDRQELIYLPTTGAMDVLFDVQEGSLGKVSPGVPAVITADALPGSTFYGKVKKVAPLPDTGQSWLNPDLKVYNCKIEIESSIEGLRPGMSCTVEVIYQQLKDVLYVPVQSVVLVDDQPTVYVMTLRGAKPRKVEIGLDNNRMIHIMSGIEEGDEVLLSPPLKQAEKKSTVMKDSAEPGNSDQPASAGSVMPEVKADKSQPASDLKPDEGSVMRRPDRKKNDGQPRSKKSE